MWDQAKQLASQNSKALSTELAGVTGQQQVRQSEVVRLGGQVSLLHHFCFSSLCGTAGLNRECDYFVADLLLDQLVSLHCFS